MKHIHALRMLYDSTNALRVLYECSTSAEVLYECFTNALRMLYESRSVLRVLYEHIESSTRVYEWSTNEEVFYECSTSVLRVGRIQNVHKGQSHCKIHHDVPVQIAHSCQVTNMSTFRLLTACHWLRNCQRTYSCQTVSDPYRLCRCSEPSRKTLREGSFLPVSETSFDPMFTCGGSSSSLHSFSSATGCSLTIHTGLEYKKTSAPRSICFLTPWTS